MPTISIWNKCNNNCLMCSNPSDLRSKKSNKNYSFEKIVQRVKCLELKDDKINLTGGEPTIHPKFFEILNQIRKKFPHTRIEIDTNGRRFFYKEFTQKLLNLQNLNLVISLHGYDAKTHDLITRTPGSFEQTIKGLFNLLKYRNSSHQVELRIIITKITCQNTTKILKFFKDNFSQVDRVVIIFMEMEGQAGENFKIVGLTHSQFQTFIPKIAKWIPEFKGFRFYHFPLCTIEYSLWKYVWRTLPNYEVTFLPQCETCLYKKYCLGIHKDYLKKIGGKEFKPIKKKYIIKETGNFYRPIKDVFIH